MNLEDKRIAYINRERNSIIRKQAWALRGITKKIFHNFSHNKLLAEIQTDKYMSKDDAFSPFWYKLAYNVLKKLPGYELRITFTKNSLHTVCFELSKDGFPHNAFKNETFTFTLSDTLLSVSTYHHIILNAYPKVGIEFCKLPLKKCYAELDKHIDLSISEKDIMALGVREVEKALDILEVMCKLKVVENNRNQLLKEVKDICNH
jgi:hypothetical protein